MAWRELTVTDQREEFVKLALVPGANITELCRRFGIARSCGHKWVRRYLAEGPEGLMDRSRRPHHSPGQTIEAVEAAVLRIREESNNAWGGRKIARLMRDDGQLWCRRRARSQRFCDGVASWSSARASIPGPISVSSASGPTNSGRWISRGTFP